MLDVVIDVSHHNIVESWDEMKASGIAAVLHKATQGVSFIDSQYASRRQQALDCGLLWGAYHFGECGDPITEAEHFLAVVQPAPTDLLVLDFEEYIDSTMSLAEAELFVLTVQARTGRWPGLYSGQSFLTDQLAARQQTVLRHCWLWLARYSTESPIVPPFWDAWDLWQYCDNGTVPGVEGVCDRNKFNGSEDQLYARWGVAAPGASS